MRFAISVGFILLSIMWADSYLSPDYEPSSGSIEGTVTLSEKSTVVRGGHRGRYGRKRPVRSQNDNGEEVKKALIWLEGSVVDENNRMDEKPVLNQVNESFDPNLITINKGDTVRILNSDPIYHNVFSLSKTKKFDVGRRPKGEYKEVAFDKAGKVDVFCDIHSNMHAVIYVLPPDAVTWAISEVDEPFSISGVPPGTYSLRIFAIGFEEFQESIEIAENETVELGTVTLSN